jgi:hypothetical protein
MIECIDTPGFGDDNLSDYQGLERLAEFLDHRHRSRAVLTSVFYLISIKNNKIDGSALKQAKALKALIGNAAWSNTIFIFTHALAANMLPGPLKRQAEVDEKQIKLRWEDEIFSEAKEKGAKFKDLGLDVSDVKEMELAERATVRVSAEDEDSDLEKDGGNSSDVDSETALESGVADDRDTSTSKSSVYRSVQRKKGMFKVRRRWP